MKIETARDRAALRARTSTTLEAAHERLREAQRLERAREDGFLTMCEANHREAVERDRAEAARVIIVPTKAPEPPKEDPVARLEQKTVSFLNGLSIGAVVALLAVWALLLAAGVV